MKTARDFERCLGEKVEVRLFSPMKGKKTIEGILAGYDGKNIRLDEGEGEYTLELSRVAKICRAIDFDD